jgi:hypothetical protein
LLKVSPGASGVREHLKQLKRADRGFTHD